MIQYGYWDVTQNKIVWCGTRTKAEQMAKAMNTVMYERDVSNPRVSAIRG